MGQELAQKDFCAVRPWFRNLNLQKVPEKGLTVDGAKLRAELQVLLPWV